ncbi:MAG: hypothetical protein JXQ71_04915 [Verrucomicrobia bacterium]|nr:hypothetical protein [Verrucomicrobiota bacterium]
MNIRHRLAAVLWTVLVMILGAAQSAPGAELIGVPVFESASNGSEAIREWQYFVGSARRVGRFLGWDLQQKPGSIGFSNGAVRIQGTVLGAGIPCRNETVELDLIQHDLPVILLLRMTDAFGELAIRLDMLGGTASAQSIAVTRIMTGKSTPSPRPHESTSQPIAQARFAPLAMGCHRLAIRQVEERITLDIDAHRVLAFADPDPAGGLAAVGSAGTVSVKSVRQCELVDPAELERREQCLREAAELAQALDAEFAGDVAAANRVEAAGDRLRWTYKATGCRLELASEPGRVAGALHAGLYGDDLLLNGPFPWIEARAQDGRIFKPDPHGQPALQAGKSGIRMTVPLRDDGGVAAQANVAIRFTVHPVWFWRVSVSGMRPARLEAQFAVPPKTGAPGVRAAGDVSHTVQDKGGRHWLRHNGKSGVYLQAGEPGTLIAAAPDDAVGGCRVSVSAASPELRFGTLWLPAQPLNPTGFTNRMVHFIRYTMGPVGLWREGPSPQEYPAAAEIDEYARHGTEAMVWHHTWVANNYRRREGFVINDAEMRRAMGHCHRRGIAVIPYLGIVPGRCPLLRHEDLAAAYDKNWDLQDFTFYASAGRWQEVLPWLTDTWCRKYGIDGFYVDGTLGLDGWGLKGAHKARADAEGLTQDEITYRLYYRVKKVLARHRARFGLENWGGSPVSLLTPFYDCRMIGEAFQRAQPEAYRDGYNPLLTGTAFKMYGMRDTSRDDYNLAMAAINLSDIQICSGNLAWGCHPITPADWNRLGPFWTLLESVDFGRLAEAMPWWAQQLVVGEGIYAAHYTQPGRVLVFLANRSNEAGTFDVQIDTARLPPVDEAWRVRRVYPEVTGKAALGAGKLRLQLPALERGPVGIELTAGGAP